jgi:hypothetical protein
MWATDGQIRVWMEDQYAGLCICGRLNCLPSLHQPEAGFCGGGKVEAILARATGPWHGSIPANDDPLITGSKLPVALFAQAESSDDLLIPGPVFARQVLQELVAAADELEEAAPRRVVLLVLIEVLAELIDSRREDGNLHFRRAGIFSVRLVLFDDLVLLVCFDRHRGMLHLDTRSPAAFQTAGRPVILGFRAAPSGNQNRGMIGGKFP